jgi:hypothetical protein
MMDTGNPSAPRLLPGRSKLLLFRTSGAASLGRVIACLLMTALAVFVAGAGPAAAKQKLIPRTISGRVLDENENGISGAAVELLDLQTGKKIAIFSESDGRYKFSDLSLNHDYEIRATFKGVSSETRKASALAERQLVLNLRIPPPKS